MGSLWSSYGPGIVAGGAALLRQGAATTSGAAAAAAFIAPAAAAPRAPTRQDTAERRRQLEAELAALEGSGSGPTPGGVPMPAYSYSSRNSSDADLRGRAGGMKFEEIEVPSDVEGYDVGSSSGGEGGSRPEAAKRGSSSWFGWGSPGYEKVKSD